MRNAPTLIPVAFLATTLATTIPAVGAINALAMTAGAAAYGCMAAAIAISTRLPITHRLFGPLDKAYGTHKVLGLASVALIITHAALTLAAPDISPLHAATARGPVVPLAVMGVVGLLLLLVAAGSALNVKVPYHRFQKIHGPAAGTAFTVLSIHAVVAVAGGPVQAPVPAIWTLVFSLVGMAGLVQRLLSRRQRPERTITAVTERERAVEVTWQDDQRHAHRPGQFVIATLDVDGRRESHPFTLTNAAGSTTRSILVRSSGDFTTPAQHAIRTGDTVAIEGPFGDFLSGTGATPELWIAGGAGITPFLSALRTAAQTPDAPHPPVRLVVAAHNDDDAPCWNEISRIARALSWLTLQSAFSDDGNRLTPEALDAHAAEIPSNSQWYVCGPSALVDAARQSHRRLERNSGDFHAEAYSWR